MTVFDAASNVGLVFGRPCHDIDGKRVDGDVSGARLQRAHLQQHLRGGGAHQQGLTLVPISAQLELILPLSAQIQLTLSPV